MNVRRWRRGVTLPVLLLGLWWLVARWHLVNQHLLVPPSRVLQEGLRWVRNGELWPSLGASLGRNLIGLALGAVAGLLVGGLLGASRIAERLFGPTLNAVKQVAVFAFIPLMSLWFGYGEPAKLVSIALAAFYPVALNTRDGVRAVALEHREVAEVLRLTGWQRLRRLILPAAAPAIFAGLRLALVYAWVATIGAEYFLAVGPGIGRLMIEGRDQLRMDRVLLGVAIMGGVGYALHVVASGFETYCLRWRKPAR